MAGALMNIRGSDCENYSTYEELDVNRTVSKHNFKVRYLLMGDTSLIYTRCLTNVKKHNALVSSLLSNSLYLAGWRFPVKDTRFIEHYLLMLLKF